MRMFAPPEMPILALFPVGEAVFPVVPAPVVEVVEGVELVPVVDVEEAVEVDPVVVVEVEVELVPDLEVEELVEVDPVVVVEVEVEVVAVGTMQDQLAELKTKPALLQMQEEEIAVAEVFRMDPEGQGFTHFHWNPEISAH